MIITIIGRAIATAIIAVGAISLTSCEVTSKHPLSDPDSSRPDPALYGTWLSQENDNSKKDGKGVVFLGKAWETKHGDVPAGIMRAVAIGFDKEAVERPMEFLFFVTQFRDGNYMNVFDKEALNNKKHEAWNKTAIKGYILFKYRLSDDKLEIWGGRSSAVRDAIESGKLQGKFTKILFCPSAELSDTTARLTEYFEKSGGGEIFREENDKRIVLLRRRNP